MKKELGNFISVEQMNGRNGNPAMNQFIIHTDKGSVFQSYDSIIAAKIDGKVYLDVHKWDYSLTTGKYRNIYLGCNIQETRDRIKSGRYKLADLNVTE